MKKLLATLLLLSAPLTANAYWSTTANGEATYRDNGVGAMAFCNQGYLPTLILSKDGSYIGSKGGNFEAVFDNGVTVPFYGLSQENMVQVVLSGTHSKIYKQMKAGSRVRFYVTDAWGKVHALHMNLTGSSKALTSALSQCEKYIK